MLPHHGRQQQPELVVRDFSASASKDRGFRLEYLPAEVAVRGGGVPVPVMVAQADGVKGGRDWALCLFVS